MQTTQNKLASQLGQLTKELKSCTASQKDLSQQIITIVDLVSSFEVNSPFDGIKYDINSEPYN